MMLDQDKLDVICKTQSNPFNWKGQFTPELIDYLLSEYAHSGAFVADTFSGSGTVLIESVKRGCDCVGFDINPTAYYMSSFYQYSSLSSNERWRMINDVGAVIDSQINGTAGSIPVYVADKDYRRAYANLLAVATWISRNVERKYWPFIINVLFLCEKDKGLTINQSMSKNMNRIGNFLLNLPYCTSSIKTRNEDARNISKYYKEAVDLIITSPPYVNVFNYHQNYRGIIECFNYDILNVANSEIGSNRKHRSNRYKTVVQYAVDMGHVLTESAKALKVGGRMVYVVGRESNVRKTPFYNSLIISDLINEINGLTMEDKNSRSFTNRYGETIYEDILTIQKCSGTTEKDLSESFRQIGYDHLKKAISYSPKENEGDIMSIINGLDNVAESPILTYHDTLSA